MLETRCGASGSADASVLGTVTHQHIFGLTFRVIWPLLAGRRVFGTVHFAWETLLPNCPRKPASSPARRI